MDNGGVGLESQLQAGINEMITALKAKGYRKKGFRLHARSRVQTL
jgi:hypothetical protein